MSDQEESLSYSNSEEDDCDEEDDFDDDESNETDDGMNSNEDEGLQDDKEIGEDANKNANSNEDNVTDEKPGGGDDKPTKIQISDDGLTVSSSETNADITASGRAITISGSDNMVRITGDNNTVVITGDNNQVILEGNGNTDKDEGKNNTVKKTKDEKASSNDKKDGGFFNWFRNFRRRASSTDNFAPGEPGEDGSDRFVDDVLNQLEPAEGEGMVGNAERPLQRSPMLSPDAAPTSHNAAKRGNDGRRGEASSPKRQRRAERGPQKKESTATWRNIRAEQDAEYNHSLRVDQEKARKKEEERKTNEAKEKDIKDKRSAAREGLPPEPDANKEGVFTVILRQPGTGTKIQRNFRATDSVQILYQFALADPRSPPEFSIVSPDIEGMRAINVGRNSTGTLAENGITSRIILCLKKEENSN